MAFDGEFKIRDGSNYERALKELQEGNSVLDYKEKDGRYFAYGRELTKEEYDRFLEKVNIALDIKLESKRQDLEQSA